MGKLLYGVGINDADYPTRIQEYIVDENGKRKRVTVWRCPIYTMWSNMLQRCYSLTTEEWQQSYIGCTVVKDWHRFSTFSAWVLQQDWEGKQLDKDLLAIKNPAKDFSKAGPIILILVTSIIVLILCDF